MSLAARLRLAALAAPLATSLLAASLLAASCTGPATGVPDGGAPDRDLCGSGADDGGADAAAGDGAGVDAGAVDASPGDVLTVDGDGGAGAVLCAVNGNPGQCMDATACAALPAFGPVAGYCPGPASVQCCVLTPDVANNPPVPAGWTLMQQSQVTAEMTAWAVAILHDPVDYPMFATALRTFGTLTVMARVEWHPPDFQNGVVHRGVTLYVP